MFAGHNLAQARHDVGVVSGDVVRFADVRLQVVQLDPKRLLGVFAQDVLTHRLPATGPDRLLAAVAGEFPIQKRAWILFPAEQHVGDAQAVDVFRGGLFFADQIKQRQRPILEAGDVVESFPSARGRASARSSARGCRPHTANLSGHGAA